MRLYFIGICGTAMGNAALLMRDLDLKIEGSDDNVYPPMSDLLAACGITVKTGYDAAHLELRPELVVIGNAMSRGNPEVEYVLEQRIPYISLPELLKQHVIQGKESIVVTGTHGKTTTTSLMAWTFERGDKKPTFLIGGVPENFAKGYQSRPESPFVILEGDEYDSAFFDKRSKFLHYLPTTLVINNIEFDHADIFSSLEEIKLAFRRATLLVPKNGVIIANGDDEDVREVIASAPAPVETFGLREDNTWRADNIVHREMTVSFDVIHGGECEARLELALVGEFNVLNALAVVATARRYTIPYEVISDAFKTFTNVKRRFELKGEFTGVRIYDDFAHHPTAIRHTLHALRTKFPLERIFAVFEPRSNTTRRNIFQKELAESFLDADVVLISQIAREHLLAQDERLDPQKVIADLKAAGKEAYYLADADAISSKVVKLAKPGDVVMVMSNGSFGGIHDMIKQKLDDRSAVKS
jgi:UDP-N-acetylmuramate: L-alanyl-gamma-D-glutamyl-meso-diaminopimelate ligase